MKQLGALMASAENYRQNSCRKFHTYILLYRFFLTAFFQDFGVIICPMDIMYLVRFVHSLCFSIWA